MKKNTTTLAIILAIALCLTMLSGCNTTENSGQSLDEGSSERIILTKGNFEDYFSIQFDAQNVRLKTPNKQWSRTLCDLVVKIDNLTNKDLSNVKIELKINIDEGIYHSPKEENNEFIRTISIPASGSADFTITLETPTTVFGVEPPQISDISYTIVSVSGTLS